MPITSEPNGQSNQPRQPVKPVGNTDHLVPHANRLLIGAGKGAWWMVSFLAGIAIRIPRWFVHANRRHLEDPGKAPSPNNSQTKS